MLFDSLAIINESLVNSDPRNNFPVRKGGLPPLAQLELLQDNYFQAGGGKPPFLTRKIFCWSVDQLEHSF
jgi:hypothetical protein